MAWYDPAWTRRKALTVDHTKVAGGPHVDYPLAVVLDADADLAASARADGYDFVFAASDGTTKLDHERVRWGPRWALSSGVWTWFNDPRAVYSSAYGKTYYGAIDSAGSPTACAYDHASGVTTSTVLHSALELDDHDNPGLLVLHASGPNPGKVLCCYSQHTSGNSYSRVSSSAGSIASFAAEVTASTNSDAYAQLVQLPGDSYNVYWFYRRGSGTTKPQSFRVSSDGGASWGTPVDLFQVTGQRPYFKYKAHPTDSSRIDCFCTDGQPDETATSIYHFYIKVSGGARSYYKSDGTLIGTDSALPLSPASVTKIYDGSTDRAWVWSANHDASGNPAIAFAVFAGGTSDHRYRLARWSGSAWALASTDIANGGDISPHYLYSAQQSYSGGICCNPSNIDEVYVSRRVLGRFEIQRYTTSNSGTSWAKAEDVTSGSADVNARPCMPVDYNSGLKLLWFRGRYTSYTDYDAAIQTQPATGPRRLYAYVRVPSLSSSVDTGLYLYYGNASATDQANPTGVWGSTYKAVLHGANSSSDSTKVANSTSVALSPTKTRDAGTMAGGQIDKSAIDAGQAVAPQASNPAISLGTGVNLAGLSAFTIEAWVKPPAGAASKPTIYSSWQGSPSAADILFRVNDTTGTLEGFLVNSSTAQVGGSFAGAVCTYGAWQHAALQFDATNGLRALVNGSASATSFAASATSSTASNAAYAGNDRSVASLGGELAELRVSSVRRDDNWLLSQYRNLSAPSTFYAVGAEESARGPFLRRHGGRRHGGRVGLA